MTKRKWKNETNRKRIGVPKPLWDKMGKRGQVACSRMFDAMQSLDQTLEELGIRIKFNGNINQTKEKDDG